MKGSILYGFLVVAGLSSCKKDDFKVQTCTGECPVQNTLVSGNNTTSFKRLIGGESANSIKVVKQTSDGGYVIFGTTENLNASESDLLVVKTDAFGETIWNRTFSGNFSDYASSIAITSDNGFILAGVSTLTPVKRGYSVPVESVVIKIDVNGNETWRKTFQENQINPFWMSKVIQAPDGGYVINVSKPGSASGVLLKLDVSGNEEWATEILFGTAAPGQANLGGIVDYASTTDGGYILGGNANIQNTTSPQILSRASVIKTNAEGDTVWSRSFPEYAVSFITAVEQNAAGDYIVCGRGTLPSSEVSSLFIRRLNQDGNQIWNKDFAIGVDLIDIAMAGDGGFFFLNAAGTLFRFNENGEEVWRKETTPGTISPEVSLATTNDNGVITTGRLANDGLVIKTDENGN